jgi:hypothetical protein
MTTNAPPFPGESKERTALLIEIKVRHVPMKPFWKIAKMPELQAVALPEDAELIPMEFETYPPMTVASPFGKVRLFVRNDDKWFIEALLPIATSEAEQLLREIRKAAQREVLDAVEREMRQRIFEGPLLQSVCSGLDWVAEQLHVYWRTQRGQEPTP